MAKGNSVLFPRPLRAPCCFLRRSKARGVADLRERTFRAFCGRVGEGVEWFAGGGGCGFGVMRELRRFAGGVLWMKLSRVFVEWVEVTSFRIF